MRIKIVSAASAIFKNFFFSQFFLSIIFSPLVAAAMRVPPRLEDVSQTANRDPDNKIHLNILYNIIT